MDTQKLWSGIAAVAALTIATSVLPAALSSPAAAQGANPPNPTITNLIPESAATTIHAKIQKIDPQTRQVTLVTPRGETVILTAADPVRLDMLKVGDTVNAKYYRSVAFLLSPNMNTPPNEVEQITAQPAQAPGGVAVRLTRVSGLIVGIDLAANTIEVVNPTGGGVYNIRVTDPARIAMLPTLKVGETITAVISQTIAISIEPAPKSWFNWL